MQLENTASPTALSGTDAALAVGAAFILQEVQDVADPWSQAKSRSEAILDHLDEIRHGLLVGAIPIERLRALEQEVRSTRAEVQDPRLRELLDEIDLRAKVELAKLSRAA